VADDERKNLILDAAKESQKFAEKILEPAKDAALAHQKMIEDIMRPNKMMEEFMRPQKLMEEFGRPPEEYLKALMPQRDLFRQIDPAIFVNPNAASEFQKRLMGWIADFEKNLDQEHEVGVRLVSFGHPTRF
jgi:hypothetical protein